MGGQTKVQGSNPAAAAKTPAGVVESLNIDAFGNLLVANNAVLSGPFTANFFVPLGVALDVITAFAPFVFKRVFVTIHFSVPIVSADFVIIEFVSAAGVVFDTIILNQPVAVGTQDFFFAIPDSCVFAAGDEIKVRMTMPQPGVSAGVTIQADGGFA